MRFSRIAIAVSLWSLLATQALADDYNWTGAYVGVHGGQLDTAFGRPDDHSSPTQEIGTGAFGGAQIGYNYQMPFGLVVGAEIDASTGHMDSGTYHDGSSITVDTQINAFATARLRAGWAIGRFLPYVTGGVIVESGDTSEHCPKGVQFGHCRPYGVNGTTGVGHYDETEQFSDVAFVYGAGLEISITGQLSVKAEYLRADFGTETHDLGPKSWDRQMSQDDFQIIRGGINYRF